MEVDADATLGELACDILAMTEFDGDQWSEFYLASAAVAKKRVPLADGMADCDRCVIRLSALRAEHQELEHHGERMSQEPTLWGSMLGTPHHCFNKHKLSQMSDVTY